MKALVSILIFAGLAPFVVWAETGAELKARGTVTPALVTCYAPGPNDNIEGPWATSRPRPQGACVDGGGSIPMTLDAFRTKKCKYVTLAANEAFYGRYFYIGTVRYASPIKEADGKGREYEVTDVIGYVHDIGPAFQSGKCARYNTCADIGRKFDVALGDFRGWNSRNASQFVDNQRFCRNFSTSFYQIGGAPVSPPSPTSQIVGGDIAIVPGDPRGTSYGPFGLGTQPYLSPAAMGTVNSGQGAFASPSPVATSPFAANTSVPQQTAPASAAVGVYAANTIIIQPSNPKKGMPILVSWASVNMKTGSCVVRKEGDTFAEGAEGSKHDSAPLSGAVEYVLSCTTPTGEEARSTASISMQ